MARRQGSRAKMREHFLANIGRVISSDELRGIANASEWARRIRELRNEEGLAILTHNDRASLKPGEYLLETDKPRPAFARGISKELRAFVLDRNGYTCQMCGAAAGEPDVYNPSRKVRLHIGHIIDKTAGGEDVASNLRALCSTCNEGARNLTLDRPSLVKLLIQIRRATKADQAKVYEWLQQKFEIAHGQAQQPPPQ